MNIGTARMDEDGIITLRLRAEDKDSGLIGKVMLEYHPDDAKYDEIVKHLPDLERGKTVPVPPWDNE